MAATPSLLVRVIRGVGISWERYLEKGLSQFCLTFLFIYNALLYCCFLWFDLCEPFSFFKLYLFSCTFSPPLSLSHYHILFLTLEMVCFHWILRLQVYFSIFFHSCILFHFVLYLKLFGQFPGLLRNHLNLRQKLFSLMLMLIEFRSIS